jgi:hypothetical protein
MFNAIRDILGRHPTAAIDVTGHSLGAALATFAAIDIKKNFNFNKFTFYTFGSPRTGNTIFSDYVFSIFPDGTYTRVTHYDDMVVHLPPQFLEFTHTGNEVWYMKPDKDLTHKTCYNSVGAEESELCANQMFATGIQAHLTYLGKPLCHDACVDGSTEHSEALIA